MTTHPPRNLRTLEVGADVYLHRHMADMPHGTKLGTIVGIREAITTTYVVVKLAVPYDLMRPGDECEFPHHHLLGQPL
jgi:hypothetical protein